MGDEQRNLFIAIGLIIAIMLGYQTFITGPAMEQRQAELEAEQAQALINNAIADPDLPIEAAAQAAEVVLERDDALSNATRIEIDAPGVVGTLSLTGARFDDLRLRRHTQEVDGDALVSLLNPIGGERVFYARDGWQDAGSGLTDLPGGRTEWQLRSGGRLTPDTPVTLGYESESGLNFERTISVDENYLFTIIDEVTNSNSDDVSLSRYGLVRHEGMPDDLNPNLVVFEGALAVVDGQLTRSSFKKMEDGDEVRETGEGGWVGITQRYWMAAAIPEQGIPVTTNFRTTERAGQVNFETTYVERARTLGPGASMIATSHIYAGAKELDVLRHVQDEVGIANFDMAINWGWLWFLVRPFVWLLNILAGMFGHFGLAILALTLMIKIVMFPLANRAYASMAKMKAVAPKMQEIKERYKSDQQKQQQATMELYQKEKINPLAGCLPILPQIPIFFALYQTLFNAIEMRHAPFFGWINDLSAADPTTMWNLFGILPFDPAVIPVLGGVLGGTGILAIGLWPLIMGITMAAQQALNPPPPDPMQAKIFAFLPVVFTVILAPFAAGLVIYWAWNNFLSVAQQYIIMRRNGNETQLDKLIGRLRDKYFGSKS
jgi:YidC/Oxa1 family membrane protein insertase